MIWFWTASGPSPVVAVMMSIAAWQKLIRATLERHSDRNYGTHMKRYGPVMKFRVGRIEATIWDRRNNQEAVWCVGIQRLYKEGDEVKVTAEFRRGDLPKVAKVWDMACAWIGERLQTATPNEADG
jgi:hypothetical protein